MFGVPWLILDWRKVRRLAPEERKKVPPFVIYPFTVLAIIVLALQALNVASIRASWPFFAALTLCVAFAFQQFVLLVQMGLTRES